MSIMSSGSATQDDNYELLQKQILNKIRKNTLSDNLREIESIKKELGDTTYKYLTAIAYYSAGDVSKTINILEDDYDRINNETKFFLADIYTARNDISSNKRAAVILKDVFNNDKYLNGLYAAFFRLYEKSDAEEYIQYYYWLDKGLIYDPENPAIIEAYASKLANEKKHQLAADEFRKLSLIINYEYYELVARINEVLNGNFKSNSEILEYICHHIEVYPNVKNEGLYRLGMFFVEQKESYFFAYKCLRKASLTHETSRVKDIILLKFNILKDEKKASKALGKLKIFSKPKDALKLSFTRSNA